MITKTAIGLGYVMFIVGLLGLVPGVVDFRGDLFGVFQVNFTHNVIHVLTGLIAISCGSCGLSSTRVFFLVFGVAFGVVAVLGFMQGDNPVFGLIANNEADSWLNTGIAAAFLAMATLPAHEHEPVEEGISHDPPPVLRN